MHQAVAVIMHVWIYSGVTVQVSIFENLIVCGVVYNCECNNCERRKGSIPFAAGRVQGD